MLENIVVGLMTGLITGVLSGYYSGLVVSRTARFSSLLRDAERPLKQIEYMQEDHRLMVRGFDRKAMDRAADDLAADRQVAASIAIRLQINEIIREIDRARQGKIDVAMLEEAISTARAAIMVQRAHRRVFLPWGSP